MNLQALLPTIIVIGFVDSLNPSLFAAQFVLLTTPRPTARIFSYIAGVLTVNFFGGLLILAGARALLTEIAVQINPVTLYGGQLLLGLAILGFGLWMRLDQGTSATPEPGRKPRSLRPIHTFALGMVVMLNELTTALPYFVAIERITQANLSAPASIAVLALYNAVFSLPLFGFMAVFLVNRERFSGVIARVNAWLTRWMPRLIKYGSILLGAGLALTAISPLLNAIRA
jgi:cytochrome c biogenesis protein CcdA